MAFFPLDPPTLSLYEGRVRRTDVDAQQQEEERDKRGEREG